VLGSALQAARTHAGMSQAALAARLGRSQTAVSRWERSDLDPTPVELLLLCLVLRLNIESLLRATLAPPDLRRRSNRAWPKCIRLGFGYAVRHARRRASQDTREHEMDLGLSSYRMWQIESGSDPTAAELQHLVESGLLDVADAAERALCLAALDFVSPDGDLGSGPGSRRLAAAFDILGQDRVDEDLMYECPLGGTCVSICKGCQCRQRSEPG
jgi:transcriptional regulator with XRE-family HTH domain